MNEIKLLDPQAQYQRIQPKIRERMDRVLNHGHFIMGPEITELEEKLAAFAGVPHAIGCSNGTDALLLALMAYEIKPGDAVFTTPFTFIATAEVIALLGATPVFLDIDRATFNLDPQKIEAAIDRVKKGSRLKPRGIIAVDLFGLPADYDAIDQIAQKNQLFVVEDAAQSFGASYKGKRAGSLAKVAATSFFPAKPLGCYGDGGAIFTGDTGLAEKMKSLRAHGQGKEKYHHLRVGLNARLDTLQAAVLLAKLDIFESEIKRRQEIAQLYSEGLKGLLKTPQIPINCASAWAQYSILHPKREAVRQCLSGQGIPTAIYYPVPLHLQDAFSHLAYSSGSLPVTEEISEEIFSLPMHPYLDNAQVEKIIQSVREALRQI